ncbi:MAG: ABC transporter permease [Caryophanon sp.]|nr:ABC transporter permease [Caryophanon sp.]
MRNFFILWQKEWTEHVRNYRIIWLPLLFLLLGMMDPLTYYFMDDLLSAVGNLPDGMQITLPNVGATDMIGATTGQLQSIGIIVLMALYCSSISGERKNGTATLLYIRPVHSGSIFMSKWVMAMMMAIVTTVCALAASSYYAEILYGELPFTRVAVFAAIYIVWLMTILSLTLMLSALTTTAIAATVSIAVVMLGMMADALIGAYWTYSPYKLATYGLQYVEAGTMPDALTLTLLLCVSISIVCVALGIAFTHMNKQQTTV